MRVLITKVICDTTITMSTNIENLLIAKPKKSEGTFVCEIKQPFILELPGSQLIHLKDTNDSGQFIFLKNKPLYNYIYDLNNRIIDIVKDHCHVWFNTNMSSDLIDDYYMSTLVYDKTHGELIKLKVVDPVDQTHFLSEEVLGSNLNIRLKAKNLRFYKQKFVLETTLEDYETVCDIIEFSDDDGPSIMDEEELAYPSATELNEMKEEMVSKYSNVIKEITEEISKLTEKLDGMNKKKEVLENASEPEEIIKLYNEFEY